jgi:S1-C subfamily serine protease
MVLTALLGLLVVVALAIGWAGTAAYAALRSGDLAAPLRAAAAWADQADGEAAIGTDDVKSAANDLKSAADGIVVIRTALGGPSAMALPREPGILVVGVLPDSPAAKAGLKRGDILLKVDDKEVDGPAELVAAVEGRAAGETVKLTVRHGDEERVLSATAGAEGTVPFLGLVPAGGGPAMAMAIAGGPLVTKVVAGGPAATAGVNDGDVIRTLDGEDLETPEALQEKLAEHKPGDRITLEVGRPGEDGRTVTVTLGEHPEKAGTAYLGIQYTQPGQAMHFAWSGHPAGFPCPEGPMVEPLVGDLPEGHYEQGVVLGAVAAASPAVAAGLKDGDVVVAVDGTPIDGAQALADAVTAHKPGEALKLSVARHGEEALLDLTATLAEHPDQAGKAYLGVAVRGYLHLKRSADGGDQDVFMERLPFGPEAGWLEHLGDEGEVPGLRFEHRIGPLRFHFGQPDSSDPEPATASGTTL